MAVIIAEVGTHHMGSMVLAEAMIRSAKENGADMVKFQLFDTEKITTWPNADIKQEAKECELSYEQAKRLFDYGEKAGIEVFFSVFDPERVKWCEDIGVRTYKIAARTRDSDILDPVFKSGKRVIISGPKTDNWTVMADRSIYCPPGYPQDTTHISESRYWDGYSDHTCGLAATKWVLLANPDAVIEKHFCLDHRVGMDAAWSMTPAELAELKEWGNLAQSFKQG